jgi:Fe2+ transport system protein FeoA
MTCSLNDLNANQPALVSGLSAPAAIRHRLMEMGFVPGAEVEVLSRGTPALIRLHGGRVTLSHELARVVRVQL